MTAPASSQVCSSWAGLSDLPEGDKPELEPAEWERLLLVATEMLWALSGRRWSGTTGEDGCAGSAVLYREGNRCAGWSMVSWVDGGFLPRPSARGQQAMKLPHDEVTEILLVTVNDVAFTGYRATGSWLIRTDGGVWGTDDVQVTYLWGLAPPEGGVRAVVQLALELAKAQVGDSSCKLPKRVVSVTRQGVSMTLIDPQRYLDKGKLGIVEVDQWLAAVNPLTLPERGSVWSPDVAQAQRS